MSVAKIAPLPRTEMDALLLGRLDVSIRVARVCLPNVSCLNFHQLEKELPNETAVLKGIKVFHSTLLLLMAS